MAALSFLHTNNIEELAAPQHLEAMTRQVAAREVEQGRINTADAGTDRQANVIPVYRSKNSARPA